METEKHRLVITLRHGETVQIGDAEVKTAPAGRNQTRLCILAPLSVVVVRNNAINKQPNPTRTPQN